MRNGTTDIAVGMLGVIPILVIILGIVGWVLNVIKIIWALQANDLTTMFIARVVGAFVLPIGAILGWF